jgi:hypothetical protein
VKEQVAALREDNVIVILAYVVVRVHCVARVEKNAIRETHRHVRNRYEFSQNRNFPRCGQSL